MAELYKASIVRLDESLRNRLNQLAEKKKVTLYSLTNKAVENFLSTEQYTFQDLLDLIHNIPSLQIHEVYIKKEFEDCPASVCKKIIQTIENKEAFIFEEKLENLDMKIKSFDKNKIFGLYVIFLIKNPNLNQINESMSNIFEYFHQGDTHHVLLNFDIKTDKERSQDEIILFISYKKQEEIKEGSSNEKT